VKDICIKLVGNKVDLSDKRKVTTEEAQRLAKTNGVEFIETSVKNNTNVNQSFETLASNMYNVFGLNNQNHKEESIRLKKFKTKQNQEKNEGCC